MTTTTSISETVCYPKKEAKNLKWVRDVTAPLSGMVCHP